LGQVQLLAQPVHRFHLRLQGVDVLFLVGKDHLEQVALVASPFWRHIAMPGRSRSTASTSTARSPSNCSRTVWPIRREQPLEVGQSFHQQDAIGDHLGMAHLLERLHASVRRELGEAPAGLQLRMQEVLVDRSQFAGQLLVEQRQDFGIALYLWPPRYDVGWLSPIMPGPGALMLKVPLSVPIS